MYIPVNLKKNQDLASSSGYYNWDVITSKPCQLTKQEHVCMYTNQRIYIYMYVLKLLHLTLCSDTKRNTSAFWWLQLWPTTLRLKLISSRLLIYNPLQVWKTTLSSSTIHLLRCSVLVYMYRGSRILNSYLYGKQLYQWEQSASLPSPGGLTISLISRLI